MKLFVGMMLVTMVVMATLIDDSEGWRRRRRRRRGRLDVDADADSELREVVEEARSLLEKLDETSEDFDTRAQGLENEEVEDILVDQKESQKRRTLEQGI